MTSSLVPVRPDASVRPASVRPASVRPASLRPASLRSAPASRPGRTATEAPLPPTDGQLAIFREQLLEQRGFRIDQLRLLCLTRVRATRVNREIASSLMTGARSALREVRAALVRMQDGSYGLCTSCHRQLPLERLEVLPQVAKCMPCQRLSDSP